MVTKFRWWFFLFSVMIALSTYARTAFAASASEDDPWASLEGNMRWRIGTLEGRTPTGTPTSWRTARQALEMGTHTLAYSGTPWADAHRQIHALSEQNLLAWEVALIAANYHAHALDKALAVAWIELLNSWDILSETERIQRHTSLRIRILAGALASLAPHCMPTQIDDAQYLTELARIETETPGRRLRSRTEPPPMLPPRPDDTAASSDALDAGISLIALLAPSASLLERLPIDLTGGAAGCATSYARGLFALMLDPQMDGVQAFEHLTQQSVQFPIASLWLWRLAIHRYLMGDMRAVVRIAAYYRQAYPSDAESVEMMAVLSDIAADAPSKARHNWPAADAGSNPTYQWICAEAARRRGAIDAAEASLSRITDHDVHFVAAWLSLAAARSALSQGYGVHIALQTLEDVAPPLPIYDYWRMTLRARTSP